MGTRAQNGGLNLWGRMGLSGQANGKNANAPNAHRPAAAGLPTSAGPPEVHADPKATQTCCGVALELFLASFRDKSGDTVYVTACECPKCKKVTII